MDELPVIDRVRLELISRGSPARAAEFMGALLEEADDILAHLGVLIADAGADRGAVSDAAHTLKGMAAEVGALRLRAAAAALETETKPARWPGQLEAVTAALEGLRSYFGAGAEPTDRST
jgi:HPt (histidine-containing phosphotransfer) domain-containing protein